MIERKNTGKEAHLNDIPLAFVRAKLLFNPDDEAKDLIIEEANDLFFNLVGDSPSKIIGRKLSEFSPDFDEIDEKYFGKKALSFDKANPFAKLDVFITSRQKWYEVFLQYIDEETFSLLINDFTDRKNKEFQLIADQQKFKDLYENASVGIYQADIDGNILMANTAMCKILEIEPLPDFTKNLGGMKIDFTPAIYQKHFKSKKNMVGYVHQLKTNSGRDIFIRENVKMVFGRNNELLYIEGTVEDITEEKIAKDQIKNLNDIFTDLDVDPYINIQVIVRKTCEIMNAYCAIYNRYSEDGKKISSWATHNLSQEIDVEIPPQGNICFDYTLKNPTKVITLNDLSDSPYVKTDYVVNKYNLKSYLGKAVVFDGDLIGSLCVYGKDPRTFSETEQKIIETLSVALSHEHKRFELEKDYRHAQSEAEFANRAKSQFLANMSHEIRTPLNGILGFSEMLLTQEMDDQKKHMLRLIEESGIQLLQIVNDIFDYSLLDAGKVPLKESPFNLLDLIKRTASFFVEEADKKKLKLYTELEGIKQTDLFGDYLKLNQILVNIISNAIKFTDEGSVIIQVKTRKKGDNVEVNILVEDTGIGINKEQLNLVFDEFKQLDYYLTKRIKGTGLGLAITKKLVDFLQGRIFAESEPGTGSRFNILIPFQIAPTNKKEFIMKDKSDEQIESTVKVKILLAEDNEANQFLIKAITKSKKWEITVVDDGDQAVEAFKNTEFNLILMDVQMPVMNGYEATGIIRELEKDMEFRTPIVALTAYAMKSDKDQCINAGMDDYISKPFKRQEFLDMVEKSLKFRK